MSLKYEPASEQLHIYVNELFLSRWCVLRVSPALAATIAVAKTDTRKLYIRNAGVEPPDGFPAQVCWYRDATLESEMSCLNPKS